MASLVLGVVGAAVGFVAGGPMGAKIGFMLGSALGGALFPPPGQDGPRLTDLKVQGSQYGAPIPIVYGTFRITGQSIWAADLVEHEQEVDSGSGGGGATQYTYTCSFAISLCEGVIAGVRRIWADGKLIYDISAGATDSVLFKAGSYKLYLGTEVQFPDPTIEAHKGVGNVPAYRGQAYWVFTDLELGKFGNRIPNLSFEVVMDGSAFMPPPSKYGEAYGMTVGSGQYDDTFQADMAPDGMLWLSTPTGHAAQDGVSGEWVLQTNARIGPQIQLYDTKSKTLVWATNISAEINPINGAGVYCDGHYIIGRGSPGSVRLAPVMCDPGPPALFCCVANPYSHGVAISDNYQISYLYDEASSGQFQNAFYWPGTPVAPPGSGIVYMNSNNGIQSTLGVGFSMGSFDEANPNVGCDCTPTPCSYGSSSCWLPGWAYVSTAVPERGACIVQGYGNYISWVTSGGADASVVSVTLPGNSVKMPALTWDEGNGRLWVFNKEGAYPDDITILYEFTAGLQLIPGTAERPQYVLPKYEDGFQSADVAGVTVDQATGYLRILVGYQYSSVTRLLLFNPVTQTVMDERILPDTFNLAGVSGRLFDLPDQHKLVFTNGYSIHDIPYGADLTPNKVLLKDIVADVSQRVHLPYEKINVNPLTDLVTGYCVSNNMAGRSAIEPLAAAYFFDAVESDNKVKFVKRGNASAVTIPTTDALLEDKS